MKRESITLDRQVDVSTTWSWAGPLIIISYCLFFLATKLYDGRVGGVHWLYLGAIAGLYFFRSWTRSFVVICLPMVVYATMYDFFAFIPFDSLLPIRVSEPYQLDKLLFGISNGSQVLLLHEFIFQKLANPFLDVVSGVFYFLHIPVFLALVLYFWQKYSSSLAQKFTLGFLVINLLAFSTYFLYPAAAPWYVTKFGFAQPLHPIPGDPAGLIRFEHIFGLHLFSENYGISPVVFGAIPSMHAGFATLGWLFSWKTSRTTVALMSVYISGMYFSALYLQHHYLLDVIIGIAYAIIAWLIVDKIFVKSCNKINERIWSIFKDQAHRPLFN